MMDPWAAADGIIDNGYHPNYVFRLSLRDNWAMQAMIPYAGVKKAHNIGLLLLNTSWGAVISRRRNLICKSTRNTGL